MIYRRLGKSGLNISVVGIGTWQYGGEWGRSYTQNEVDAILQRGKDLGINLIDTAECYGDHTSERLVGQSIKHNRDEWLIASKFGHQFHANFSRTDRFDANSVLTQLEESLRSLQTESIDLYQFHSGSNESFDNAELWEMLNRQVAAGKIRHLGLSVSPNTNEFQVRKAVEYGISVIQIVYNRLDRAPEAEIFPNCQKNDLGILARVPLASGFLSGKYKPGTQFSNPDDVRSRREQNNIDEQLKEVAHIQQNEVPAGVDMAAWALAWCLRLPVVSGVIPGCKDPAQVEANASAIQLINTFG
ncbi:MAG: aldo/keto reductase [Chloroflexi bacterium HGW-Chloroflexi-10]|nr:MAG: aldo/keto reductase [Chloroflexi bacterium HGW-Chloroflexi-10]